MNHVSVVETSNCCHRAESVKFDATTLNTAKAECCCDEASIFMLNDDCLENICRKLSITDQINFALTCQRFFNVMCVISRAEHVYVNTDNFYSWSAEIMKNFLRVVGKQIKILDIKYLPKTSILNDIGFFCRNVEVLNIYEGLLDTKSVILLMDNMEYLGSCVIHISIAEDNFFKYLEKFKYLKSLHIVNNHIITGKNIDLLERLESLELRYCYNLAPEHLRNICKNLKNLRHLDIMYNSTLKSGDCAIISKNLLQLESLKLTCSHGDINCLPELPKLKKLAIQTYENVDFIKNLTRLRGNQLEELILVTGKINDQEITALSELKNLKSLDASCSNMDDTFLMAISKITELEVIKLKFCESISDRSVLEILEKCLKLKRLDLEGCDSLTPFLLPDMVKLLRRQHSEHLRQHRIVFTGTVSVFYNNFMRSASGANRFSDLIRITIEEDNGGLCDYEDLGSYNDYDLIWE